MQYHACQIMSGMCMWLLVSGRPSLFIIWWLCHVTIPSKTNEMNN